MNKQDIIKELDEECRFLEKSVKKAKARLENAPEGNVRIVKHRKGYQFYFRGKPSDISGVYLPVSERKKAAALIQKKYDQQIIAAGEKQAAVIRRFLKHYCPDILKTVYGSLEQVRKEYITPVVKSDEDYIEEWKSFEYTPKSFSEGAGEHYTGKGERVRSKSEVMIADALSKEQICYRYECPLLLGGKLIHPDFTVLRRSDLETVYWEHFGMMDDMEYCARAIQRIRLYEENGIIPGKNLIFTMETGSLPLNHMVIRRMIREYLSK